MQSLINDRRIQKDLSEIPLVKNNWKAVSELADVYRAIIITRHKLWNCQRGFLADEMRNRCENDTYGPHTGTHAHLMHDAASSISSSRSLSDHVTEWRISIALIHSEHEYNATQLNRQDV